jgi:hypothetical protein
VGVVNISNSVNVGPVLGEDSLTEGLVLDLETSGPSGSLQAEVDAADAGEQRSEGGHIYHPAS